jgi:hypothetical protein
MRTTPCPPAGVAGQSMSRKRERRGSARASWHRRAGLGAAVLTLAIALFAPAAGAQPLPLGCQKQHGVTYCPRVTYGVHTLNNNADPTFNQLLGINMSGVIGGYFGSGSAGHPNQGYLLFPPYVQNYYANDNFPGSVQTQVTGLNDQGDMVGFYSTMNNANMVNNNFGWYRLNGQYHVGDFPTTNPASPPVDQLLGINDRDVAVGFFTDAAGNNHGYTFNTLTGQIQEVTVPGFTNVTTAGINDLGDIAGFGSVNGNTESFLMTRGGKVYTLSFPGASSTSALGVNDSDEVVGTETFPGSSGGVPGKGNTAGMHGFTWNPTTGFTIVDDRNGVQNDMTTTTVNGLNRCGDLVGFYVDGNGNTDGMLANAQFTSMSFSGHEVSATVARGRHQGKPTKGKGKPTKVKTKLPKGC